MPRDSTAREIAAEALPGFSPDNQRPCPVPDPDNTIELVVYVVAQQGDRAVLAPVRRRVSGPGPVTPSTAVRQLVVCQVSEDEKTKNLATFIPEGTQWANLVKIEPGAYEIQLPVLRDQSNKEVDDLPTLAVAQFVFTVTQNEQYTANDRVDRVRFMVNHELVAVRTDIGTRKKGEYVTRDDFTTSRPATTTTTSTTTTTTTTTTTAPPPAPGATTTTRG
ncbi:MAG TPA: hypothetical protein VGQ20_06065 [Acidimicrobiales bacterium]|nr:hypothetical protein [Acidimicrobiales bacterium]